MLKKMVGLVKIIVLYLLIWCIYFVYNIHLVIWFKKKKGGITVLIYKKVYCCTSWKRKFHLVGYQTLLWNNDDRYREKKYIIETNIE